MFEFPQELKQIQSFEKVFIARRLLSKKVTILRIGQSPKLKDVICNVPIDRVDVWNSLSRTAYSNVIIIVKLKRKLQYKGHVYFEPVGPNLFLVYWSF